MAQTQLLEAAHTSALSLAFETSREPAALLADDLSVVRANRALATLLGYERSELRGIRFEQLGADAADLLQAPAGVELHLTCRDKAPVIAHARLIRTYSGPTEPAYLFTVEGLTPPQEVRALRARCAELEEHLRVARGFLDQATDAVVVHNADQTIRYWSASAERMFGISRAQAKGKTYAQLLGPHAAVPETEHPAILRDGDWQGQLQCTLPSGQRLLVERHVKVVRHGETTSIFTINIDVGERYRAERESQLLKNLLERRVATQSAELRERAEDLRDLSYSIAHDLRSPLTAIAGYTDQLEKRLASVVLDEKSVHYLSRLRAGVATLGSMTDGLISLAAISHVPLTPQPVDMSALARRVCHKLQHTSTPRQLNVTFAETAAPIVDLALTKDLLEHLFSNALKFTSKTPLASIRFDCVTSDRGVCVFRLADNGAGFDPAYAYKLFAPFQRLHSQQEFPGIGIGLALARKIVTRHGGRIWAESGPEGTTVFFTFHDVSSGEGDSERIRIAEDVSRWERFRVRDITGPEATLETAQQV